MEKQNPDLISNLPNEILHLILASLSPKEAVRTSILSSSWKSLWAPRQVYLDSDQRKQSNAIDDFLNSAAYPRLMIAFLGNERIFTAAKWPETGELHLRFSGENRFRFDLKLEEPVKKTSHGFSSLRILRLTSVSCVTTSLVSEIFAEALLLEDLTIERCCGLRGVEVEGSDRLRRFAVADCPDVAEIAVSGPKLERFQYRGALARIRLSGVPRLADAIIDLSDGLGRNALQCDDVLAILAALKDVEKLTITGWLLQWLSTAGVIFWRLDFKFRRLKKLRLADCHMNEHKRDAIACFLNITPSLEKLYIDIDSSNDHSHCPLFDQFMWKDFTDVKSVGFKLHQLKWVKLFGFTGEENQLLVIDFLFQRAINMKSMTVMLPENRSWLVGKEPWSQLQRVVRCRPPKRMDVFCRTKGCYFVLCQDTDCVNINRT